MSSLTLPPSDLYWHALNYRTADTLGAEPAWKALLDYVEEYGKACAIAATQWMTIDSAPKDGTRILGFDGDAAEPIQICYAKAFPKPFDGYSEEWPRDKWEFFRDDKHAPGHSWSFFPTHWMPLPPVISIGRGQMDGGMEE